MRSRMVRRSLLLAIGALLASGAWTRLAAQASSDEWEFVVAPYFMGASMSGATTVRGREVDIDASASDILSNLELGAMGFLVARKGNWGFGSDLIWMALGSTVEDVDVDFSQGAYAFYGLRRLGPAADLTFGMRVNTLDGELTFKTRDIVVSQGKTWVDPLVGVTLHSPSERRVRFRVYTEVGGFGAGSDFTWQVFPSLGIGFNDTISLELGYRFLDIDYSTGEGNERFAYDVLTQGPLFGLAFRF
jgi:hypothetical protein